MPDIKYIQLLHISEQSDPRALNPARCLISFPQVRSHQEIRTGAKIKPGRAGVQLPSSEFESRITLRESSSAPHAASQESKIDHSPSSTEIASPVRVVELPSPPLASAA